MSKKIFIAGHNGMVGSAIRKVLITNENIEIITADRSELDLLNQKSVSEFFYKQKPDEVILAAAKVGGIFANNTFPAEFIYENLQIQNNIIHFAHTSGVQKLLFLGSSCIYPKFAPQPINESSLLTSDLEKTNEADALAKSAGLKMCESYNRQYGRDYRSVMPANLYGPGDNYHSENSHVVPALIRRFHEAKLNNEDEVVVWGSGNPMREFLYVDDMARASLFIHNLEKKVYDKFTSERLSHVNLGTGTDVTIADLANKISDIIGYQGKITFDLKRPDGPPRKLLDITTLNAMGYKAKTDLEDGLKNSYRDFKLNQNILRQ